MYETHFGLRRRPFRACGDSQCYYPATCHERALSQILQAIHDDEAIALLTAEPGTGKTIVGHCLLDRLGEDVTSSFLTNSHFPDRTSLLQAILYDLHQPYEGRSEQELRLTLTDFLLRNYEEGRRTVLVLDEAQHLTAEPLEELRLLGNLEGRQGRAFQVVLLAQPSIMETLCLPELASFHQRLAVHAQLEPLGLHEAADYLVHHLRAAGARPEGVVTDEAVEILARQTQGVPRLLNRAAHQALTLTYVAGEKIVDAEAALEAVAMLGLSDDESLPAEDGQALSRQEQEDGVHQETADEPGPVLTLEPAAEREGDPSPDLPRNPGRPRRLFGTPRKPA